MVSRVFSINTKCQIRVCQLQVTLKETAHSRCWLFQKLHSNKLHDNLSKNKLTIRSLLSYLSYCLSASFMVFISVFSSTPAGQQSLSGQFSLITMYSDPPGFRPRSPRTCRCLTAAIRCRHWGYIPFRNPQRTVNVSLHPYNQ